jgi:sec-independent protein translocase protein TatB
MLDVGFSEILLTSAIALVVLGPERLPKVARQVGNWMGRARAMARQLSEQLEREVNADELLKLQSKPKSAAPSPGSGTSALTGGAAHDPSYTQPPATPAPDALSPAVTPQPDAIQSADAPASDAPAVDVQAVDAVPPTPRVPDPVFGGLPPSATTPAAMHASEPVADSKPTHE